MKKLQLLCILLLLTGCVWAQIDSTKASDTLASSQLQEVVIIAQRSITDKADKPLATIDQHLEKTSSVNMIHRGSYAWEPYLNGMASERSVITIDGMRIYSACTDKMAPVTAYVEINNLKKISIHSGSSGSAGGATIAGSLNLEQQKSHFGETNWANAVFAGFETNNRQKNTGFKLSYVKPKLFIDLSATARDAANYRSGGGTEVPYSQFTKYNTSGIIGIKLNEHQHLEATVIYDQAADVGYPALPMDVLLAKAVITSVEYVRHHISPAIQQWHTKIYYNDVTHVMDDSKRPWVPIRMDMPGWSKTAGFYSWLSGSSSKHSWKANLSGHHNYSLAEMTMFPNDPAEKSMFMLTWPGVHTHYLDAFAENVYTISSNWKATVSTGIGIHNNLIINKFGIESLRIFYPNLPQSSSRLLKRLSASFSHESGNWQHSFSLAYGERAPSVSEGFGFYLFNSFDKFDYIGNPQLKNEQSVNLSGTLAYIHTHFLAKISGSYFWIPNYIIGVPQHNLIAMTIGAAGTKVYEQLKYASILNSSLELNWQISPKILWSNRLSFRRGTGATVGNLPLMQPFSYLTGFKFVSKVLSIDVSANGAAKQHTFNPKFGENELPAFVVFNLSAFRYFNWGRHSWLLKAGIENLLDKNYTTFADWNRLPRMGRNVFINLIWNL